MKYLLLTLILLISACDGERATREVVRQRTYCETDTSTQRADFIIQCINAGNPKSDEEPEDWIGMCQEMAEDTLCEKREFIILQKKIGSSWYEINARVREKQDHKELL